MGFGWGLCSEWKEAFLVSSLWSRNIKHAKMYWSSCWLKEYLKSYYILVASLLPHTDIGDKLARVNPSLGFSHSPNVSNEPGIIEDIHKEIAQKAVTKEQLHCRGLKVDLLVHGNGTMT